MYDDPRSGERIVVHYELERRLADGLRQSTQSERENGLYTQVYDTLLRELYDHPRKTAAANRKPTRRTTSTVRQR